MMEEKTVRLHEEGTTLSTSIPYVAGAATSVGCSFLVLYLLYMEGTQVFHGWYTCNVVLAVPGVIVCIYGLNCILTC